MNECSICPKDTIQCAHFDNHSVCIIKTKYGWYSVLRCRNDIEAEGHSGMGLIKAQEIFNHQVEYILR